jgi:hypothetical protein
MRTRSNLLAITALIATAVCNGVYAAEMQDKLIEVLERHTFSSAQIHRQNLATRNVTHEISLTLAYFAESGWQRDTLLEITGHAAAIIAQCGASVARLEIVQITAPQRYRYFSTPIARELVRTLHLPKPTVYFVFDTRQQPAFDAEAIGRGNSRTRPELADTVWFTRAARDPGIVLAHELMHVLMDSGEHVEEQNNLMRTETSPENILLSPAQCDRLRATGTRNGLLHPLKK